MIPAGREGRSIQEYLRLRPAAHRLEGRMNAGAQVAYRGVPWRPNS